MSYEYDVFFSYKHSPKSLYWHCEVKDLLQEWLSQALGGRQCKIFMDKEAIATGERWRDSLRHALKHSKCLVAVWSPLYFQSQYCLSEWEAFRQRESQCNLASLGLVAPIRYHDGEFFPETARDVQMTDLREHTSLLPAYWTTRDAVELDAKIRVFAQQVAAIVNGAPEFDPNWPAELLEHSPSQPSIELAKL
jgi:hypothetical protein